MLDSLVHLKNNMSFLESCTLVLAQLNGQCCCIVIILSIMTGLGHSSGAGEVISFCPL